MTSIAKRKARTGSFLCGALMGCSEAAAVSSRHAEKHLLQGDAVDMGSRMSFPMHAPPIEGFVYVLAPVLSQSLERCSRLTLDADVPLPIFSMAK